MATASERAPDGGDWLANVDRFRPTHRRIPHILGGRFAALRLIESGELDPDVLFCESAEEEDEEEEEEYASEPECDVRKTEIWKANKEQELVLSESRLAYAREVERRVAERRARERPPRKSFNIVTDQPPPLDFSNLTLASESCTSSLLRSESSVTASANASQFSSTVDNASTDAADETTDGGGVAEGSGQGDETMTLEDAEDGNAGGEEEEDGLTVPLHRVIEAPQVLEPSNVFENTADEHDLQILAGGTQGLRAVAETGNGNLGHGEQRTVEYENEAMEVDDGDDSVVIMERTFTKVVVDGGGHGNSGDTQQEKILNETFVVEDKLKEREPTTNESQTVMKEFDVVTHEAPATMNVSFDASTIRRDTSVISGSKIGDDTMNGGGRSLEVVEEVDGSEDDGARRDSMRTPSKAAVAGLRHYALETFSSKQRKIQQQRVTSTPVNTASADGKELCERSLRIREAESQTGDSLRGTPLRRSSVGPVKWSSALRQIGSYSSMTPTPSPKRPRLSVRNVIPSAAVTTTPKGERRKSGSVASEDAPGGGTPKLRLPPIKESSVASSPAKGAVPLPPVETDLNTKKPAMVDGKTVSPQCPRPRSGVVPTVTAGRSSTRPTENAAISSRRSAVLGDTRGQHEGFLARRSVGMNVWKTPSPKGGTSKEQKAGTHPDTPRPSTRTETVFNSTVMSISPQRSAIRPHRSEEQRTPTGPVFAEMIYEKNVKSGVVPRRERSTRLRTSNALNSIITNSWRVSDCLQNARSSVAAAANSQAKVLSATEAGAGSGLLAEAMADTTTLLDPRMSTTPPSVAVVAEDRCNLLNGIEDAENAENISDLGDNGDGDGSDSGDDDDGVKDITRRSSQLRLKFDSVGDSDDQKEDSSGCELAEIGDRSSPIGGADDDADDFVDDDGGEEDVFDAPTETGPIAEMSSRAGAVAASANALSPTVPRRVFLLDDSITMTSTPGLDVRRSRRSSASSIRDDERDAVEADSPELAANTSRESVSDSPVHIVAARARKRSQPSALLAKPRIVHPEEPTAVGGHLPLRRSSRNRVAPLRYWMGERPVYVPNANGTCELSGVTDVTVRDPFFVKYRTANTVEALDRCRAEKDRKQASRRFRQLRDERREVNEKKGAGSRKGSKRDEDDDGDDHEMEPIVERSDSESSDEGDHRRMFQSRH